MAKKKCSRFGRSKGRKVCRAWSGLAGHKRKRCGKGKKRKGRRCVRAR